VAPRFVHRETQSNQFQFISPRPAPKVGTSPSSIPVPPKNPTPPPIHPPSKTSKKGIKRHHPPTIPHTKFPSPDAHCSLLTVYFSLSPIPSHHSRISLASSSAATKSPPKTATKGPATLSRFLKPTIGHPLLDADFHLAPRPLPQSSRHPNPTTPTDSPPNCITSQKPTSLSPVRFRPPDPRRSARSAVFSPHASLAPSIRRLACAIGRWALGVQRCPSLPHLTTNTLAHPPFLWHE
jgi:hypothetical protein